MDSAKWISEAVERIGGRATEASDRIWEYAETGFKEFKSSQELIAILSECGFSVNAPVAGIPTAFTASYGRGKPVIGLLAEYDALTGISQKAGVLAPEEEKSGANGHGCGHNLLGAGCLAAALALKAYIDETGNAGTVIFFGCPAEEAGSGKTFMAREGIFSNVDIALSWHPADWTGIVPASTQANMQINYNFNGISSHAAAAPQLGRSALDAVELMDVGVNYLREHVTPDVRMHYAITDTGGTSPNVVQSHASVRYLLRAARIDAVRELRSRVDDIARGAALMTGTSVDIAFTKAASHLNGNVSLGNQVFRSMKELGNPAFSCDDRKVAADYSSVLEHPGMSPTVAQIFHQMLKTKPELADIAKSPLNDAIMPYIPLPISTAGSSDVGDVSLVCPTVMFMVTTYAQGTALHSWQATAQGKSSLAHAGMLYSAKVMALTAVHYMEDSELVSAAWDEHRQSMNGKNYECPIPKETPLPIVE